MPHFLTPPNSPTPIGPYSHIATAGPFILISGTAGIDPATNQLAHSDATSGAAVAAQTRQIIENFRIMLESVGSSLADVLHVNVFLLDMAHFDAMNRAYAEALTPFRAHGMPARTAIGVAALPKPGALLTMNVTAFKQTTP